MSLLPSIIFQDNLRIGQKTTGIFLLFFLSLISSIKAQTTGFLYFNSENGLANNQATSIEQDDEGHLLVGTMAGLSVYDGESFLSYGKNQGLAEQWITCLKKDKKGNIWIGHWSGGVSRWNKATGNFENIQTEKLFNYKTVKDIEEDAKGNIWFATEGEGIFYFSYSTKVLAQLIGTKKTIVSDLFLKKEKMVAVSDQGLLLISNILQPDSASTKIFGLAQGVFSKNLTSVAIDQYDFLWIGSADGGIATIALKELNETTIFRKQNLFSELQNLPSVFVKKIYLDKKANVWVATAGGGAALYSYGKGSTARDKILNGKFKTFSSLNGLNYYNVNAIFNDRDNSYWIATEMGLNQYRGDFFQLYDEQDGLSGTIIWSLFPDSKGNIWMGTNAGLSVLKENKIINFSKKEGYPEESVWAVFEDRDENLWFGTSSGAFLRRKGQSKPIKIGKSEGLVSDYILCFGEDENGFIWCGTKEGLSRINKINLSITNYGTADGLSSGYVYKIFTDSKKRTWFSCLGSGIRLLSNNKFIEPVELNSIKDRFVMSFTEDKNGKLWMATYGSGIYAFDGRKVKNYMLKDGLSSDMLHSIVSDEQNTIWVGSNKGIEKFNQKTQKFFLYSKGQGMLGEETNPGAVCLDNNNNLWFGTIVGALKLNLKEEIKNEQPPILKINGLKVNLKDTLLPIDKVFSSNENNLSFIFSAVSLIFPEKISYEFTLSGHDRSWVKVSAKTHEAHFTNLAPGKYVFKVRAYNSAGIMSNTESYSFEIKPPFWQSVLFYFVVLVFILFVLFFYDRKRHRNKKIEEEKLKNTIEKHTRQLQNKMAEVSFENQKAFDENSYASKIQDMILKKTETYPSNHATVFSITKNKETLGGDFVWYKLIDETYYFFVVDSFASGTPSSVVSVYLLSLLEQNFYKILQECKEPISRENLHVLFSEIFSDSSSVDLNKILNATAIAFFSFHSITREFIYYTKNTSLLLLREGEVFLNVSNELILSENKEQKEKKYFANDILYIFTDGFEDLFSTENLLVRDKEKAKRFLVEISKKDFDSQKNEIHKLISKQEKLLLDDLCLLAIKFKE